MTHYHKRCIKHRNYRSNERICTGIKTPFSVTSLGESLSVVFQISFVDVVKTSESLAGRKNSGFRNSRFQDCECPPESIDNDFKKAVYNEETKAQQDTVFLKKDS